MGDTLDNILVILMFTFSFILIAVPIVVVPVLLYSLYKFFSHKSNQDMYDIDEDVGRCKYCGDTKEWCRQC